MEDFMKAIIRKFLIFLDGGVDYKEKFHRIAEQISLSDIIEKKGTFIGSNKKTYSAILTGLVARQYGGDYIYINYTTEAGDYIVGARIPRKKFKFT